MTVYALAVTTAVLICLSIAVLNAFRFPRLRRTEAATDTRETISVLVPVRNEASHIGTTIRMLLAQTERIDELLILDDGSTDDTVDQTLSAGGSDPRLSVLTGKPLPNGWSGKNWACAQLACAARGSILIFTDAEVRWQPGALQAALIEMERSRADLFTVWPTQLTVTWSERLVVPLMAFSVLAYLPEPLAHNTPYASAAAATGQCLIFRRSAYAAIGGHEAVRDDVIEDVRLAQRIKRAGLQLRMADAAGLVGCRMYHTWHEVSNGYAKNILAGHGDSIFLLMASMFYHLSLFVMPWAWLALGWMGISTFSWPIWPLTLVVGGIATRALTAAISRQRIGDAPLMPFSVLLLSAIAFKSIWWRLRYSGVLWKGRVVKAAG